MSRYFFAPGMNKEYFLIFDFCGIFEYFRDNPDGRLKKAANTIIYDLQAQN
jgi:type I site-specific restriction endonuclease